MPPRAAPEYGLQHADHILLVGSEHAIDAGIAVQGIGDHDIEGPRKTLQNPLEQPHGGRDLILSATERLEIQKQGIGRLSSIATTQWW